MKHPVGYTSSNRYKCLEDLQKTSTDLYLRYCGIEQCFPGYAFGPYTREESYVLHVVTKGKGIFQVNGATYPVHAGQAFLIYPSVETYYQADQNDPWEYMWVGFNGIRSYECLKNSGFNSSHFVIDVPDVQPLRECIQNMLNAHQLNYSNDLMRTSELLKFFSILCSSHEATSKQTEHAYPSEVYVQQVIDYITFHLSEKIKIQDLADYIGINRSYLTSSFKRYKGVSPQEYLLNLRMVKAASLLKESDLPIHQIAASVGYPDPLAFSKIFKQNYKMSPRNYRSQSLFLVSETEKNDYDSVDPL